MKFYIFIFLFIQLIKADEIHYKLDYHNDHAIIVHYTISREGFKLYNALIKNNKNLKIIGSNRSTMESGKVVKDSILLKKQDLNITIEGSGAIVFIQKNDFHVNVAADKYFDSVKLLIEDLKYKIDSYKK